MSKTIQQPIPKSNPESNGFWQSALSILKTQTTAVIFDSLIKPLCVEKIADSVLYLSTVNNNVKVLEAQWKRQVLAALSEDLGIVDVVFEKAKAAPREAYIPDYEPTPEDESEPDIALTGAYHTQHDAIIQPDRKEYNQATYYYRIKWRPLLGPLLSELVRELRQRCNYQDSRNHFGVTYKTLADVLGVTERTIQRALQRDEKGDFKNPYLKYFIADIKTVKTVDTKGRIRNTKSNFVVYLNDTLTPEDQAKLDEK